MKHLHLVGGLLVSLALAASSAAAEEESKKYPFFPSLINTVTGQPVPSTEWFSPKKCRGCHAEIHDQWKGSMHSNAFRDPIFQALWKLGSDETDGLTDKLCAGCHTGIGTVAEEIKRDENGDFVVSEIAQEGVQCHFCHNIIGSSRLHTPTAMPQNASIIVDPGLVMRGPYADSEPMWHEAEYSELHTKAEFCGNCHNVFHPTNNFHIENTYNEWKFSVYAQKGIVCQDCHMMPVEKAIEVARTLEKPRNPGKASPMGPDRESVSEHWFVGGNFTVTTLLGADKHAEMAKKRLQSAAELELFIPDQAVDDEVTRMTVRVHNVGSGHHLPTSLTEIRQMWLELSVKDADGKEIYRHGGLDAEHNLREGTVVFNTEAVDEKGHHTVKPWEIVRFSYNTTIPPKGYADRDFAFLVPDDAKGPLDLGVTLRYRSYPQKVANLLLGEDAPVLPIVDMATAKKSLPVE